MAYKPLSQTVTNGKDKEIASSDAIFDFGASLVPTSVAGDVDKVLAVDALGAKSWQYAGLGAGALGTSNVILGRSKPASLTGTGNFIAGSNAGNASTTGSESVIIGLNSAKASQVVTGIISIGSNALGSLVTDNGNGNFDRGIIAIGQNAFSSLVTAGAGGDGSGSGIAIGRNAGANCNTTMSSGNIFIGTSAGSGYTSGGQSVVIGTGAGIGANSQGSIFIGYGTGRNTTGGGNVHVGRNWINQTIIGTGSSNTLIGDAVGFINATYGIVNITSGSNNVIVGSGAGCLAGTTGSAIILGTLAAGGSNECAVGSASSQINTVLLGRGGASQTVANAVKIMTMRASGTTDTSMTAGTLTLGGAQGTGTGAGGDVIIATAPASTTGSTTNAHVERIRAKSATEVVVNDTGVDFDFRVEGDTDDNLLMVDASADKVGIGVAAPAEKLEVNGNIKGGTISFNADSNRTGTVSNLGFKSNTITHDFGSISHGNSAEVTITVSGAAVGDAVFVGPPAAPEIELGWSAYVSAADTVTLRVYNTHNSNSVDPASATWRVTVLKS